MGKPSKAQKKKHKKKHKKKLRDLAGGRGPGIESLLHTTRSESWASVPLALGTRRFLFPKVTLSMWCYRC